MAEQTLNTVVARLQHLAAADGLDAVPDSELLERYTSQRDSAALELLVWRYGSMVLATCRGFLGNGPDTEDAFQATFLVLVRKAHSVRKHQSLAAWLHRVACRICLRVRERETLKRTGERAAARRDQVAPAEIVNDLRPILNAEIARLPQRFRTAFLLCQCEGKTNEDAARLLGVPKGTLLSRLARARQKLRRRLIQRGIAPAAAGLVLEATVDPVSAALVNATVGSIHTISPSSITPGTIALLAEGAIRDMFWNKIKLAACVILAVSFLGAAGVFLGSPGALAETTTAENPAEQPKNPPTDLDRLQGSWLITSLVANGKEQEESGVARMTFKGDTAGFIKRPGKNPDEFKVTLDETTNPRSIDLAEGNKAMSGIYELKGGELRIIYREKGDERPKSFDVANEGKDCVLMVLKREKPEGKPEPKAAGADDKPSDAPTANQPTPLDLLLPNKPLPMIPKDEYQMHGTWSLVEVTADGGQRDPGDLQFVFGPFQSMLVQDATRSRDAKPLSFKLNPESGSIDLTAGGKTQTGIYRLYHQGPPTESDINGLTLCLNEKGDKRPTEFEAANGSGNVLFVLKRITLAADTKWAEKLFPDGLVVDFGSVMGNEPKTVRVKIKNPYPLAVWYYDSSILGQGNWLTQRLIKGAAPIEPGGETTLELTLNPTRLDRASASLPRSGRGAGTSVLPYDQPTLKFSVRNYRPKTAPLTGKEDPGGQANGGQPFSSATLTIKVDFGKPPSK